MSSSDEDTDIEEGLGDLGLSDSEEEIDLEEDLSLESGDLSSDTDSDEEVDLEEDLSLESGDLSSDTDSDEEVDLEDEITLPDFPGYIIYKDGTIYSKSKKRNIVFRKRGTLWAARLITKDEDEKYTRKMFSKRYLLTRAFGEDFLPPKPSKLEKFDLEGGVPLLEFPDYLFFRDGRVISKLMSKIIAFQERDGYLYTRLMQVRGEERRRAAISQHRLMAMAFIPNPGDFPLVNHLDGNGLNNSIANLEWLDSPGNAQHAHDTGLITPGCRPVVIIDINGKIKERFASITIAARKLGCSQSTIKNVCNGRRKTARGRMVRYETEKEAFGVLEGEEWKIIPGHLNYKISTLGRIYTQKTKRYMQLLLRRDGYVRVHIDRKHYYVHCLVAKTFLSPPPEGMIAPIVNHKDGSKSNNILVNLEWLSFEDNIRDAHDTGLNSTSLPTIQYTLEGEEVARFPSVTKAALAAGVVHASILGACHKKESVITIAGYLWRFVSDPLTKEELETLSPGKKKVCQYTPEGTLVEAFPSVTAAAKAVGVSPSTIGNVCQGKTKTSRGFVWRFADQPPPSAPVKIGCERKVEQLTKEGELVKVWDTIAEAAKTLEISNSHITSVCKGKRITTGGFRWRYAGDKTMSRPTKILRGKEIDQLDAKGSLIKRWDAITEASDALGISRLHIGDVCRGKGISAGGFRWIFTGDKCPMKPIRIVKGLEQLDMDGNFVKRWESHRVAGKSLGIGPYDITRVCKGQRKMAGGFRWRYADDD